MSQVKECLQTQSFECSILPNAVPKACLQKVEKKTCRFENIKACQTLKNQFKYIQPSRRESCKPTLKSNVSDVPFTDDSVYNHSYYHHDVCENRTEPVVHKDHLVMAGKFQDQTSQRMSYPVQCVSMVQKVVPKNNCLGGQGPMRMMTTQKHDYYGPCNYDGFGRSKKIVQSDSLVINSDCPMVGLTTNSCSYQPVYGKRQKNFKPNQCYTTPLEKMDLNTTNRSSYKKIEKQEKIQTPWAAKLSYCKPNNTTNYCTMYNYSYKEPGAYTYKDNCGDTANLNVDSNLAKNCCPLTCLADNVDSELKSKFTKAHHFDD
ncbi:uncharacterized protein LOC114119622 isoform X1 [Aphis gossypii]|uniref:Uncharacterized protein n=1 Tax=Aphis gossypii TaxID=80765 RepID=A0A9P0J8D2_APHGO|nr:uncharacterized protein LOC114119622 isoform X1 [Aphis gossypii]CAH1726693.1 unnamed protein product [Aphis gossypii]